MPRLKDDPNKIQRNWLLFLRSQIPHFCDKELVGRGMSSLLGAFKSDYNFRALFPQGVEDPAGILVPGPMASLPARSAIGSFISFGLAASSHIKSHADSAIPISCAMDMWLCVAHASDKRGDRE